MNIFLFIFSIAMIVLGIIYLMAFLEDYRDCIIGTLVIVLGVVTFIFSIVSSSKETLYKLTITDTVTNKEKVYEFVTDIKEYESYIKFTDKDGNEQYLMMEDKEVLKEELE